MIIWVKLLCSFRGGYEPFEETSTAIFKATTSSEMEGVGSCEMLVSTYETTRYCHVIQ
jgi:hypothetical protein